MFNICLTVFNHSETSSSMLNHVPPCSEFEHIWINLNTCVQVLNAKHWHHKQSEQAECAMFQGVFYLYDTALVWCTVSHVPCLQSLEGSFFFTKQLIRTSDQCKVTRDLRPWESSHLGGILASLDIKTVKKCKVVSIFISKSKSISVYLSIRGCSFKYQHISSTKWSQIDPLGIGIFQRSLNPPERTWQSPTCLAAWRWCVASLRLLSHPVAQATNSHLTLNHSELAARRNGFSSRLNVFSIVWTFLLIRTYFKGNSS